MPAETAWPNLEARVAAVTHRGLVRPGNEDAFLVGGLIGLAPHGPMPGPVSVVHALGPGPVPDRGLVLAVADGLGGHRAGETASRLALEGLARGWAEARAETADAACSFWRDTLERTHRTVCMEAATRPEQAGMAATIAGVHLHAGWGAVTFHAGDSRVYRFRQGILKPLTVDHSQAEALRSEGPFGVETPRGSSVVWKCLGSRSDSLDPTVEWTAPALHPGDRYLLVTDGLSDVVDHDAAEAILAERPDPREAVETLLERALARGGPDNVTIVLADVVGVERPGSPGPGGEE
ncbi:MAG: serine/threonine-protein phosphatase [Firmicutes bacterium]|nr:serine/threonine-protein phosphatase [Bacillota bacterium]